MKSEAVDMYTAMSAAGRREEEEEEEIWNCGGGGGDLGFDPGYFMASFYPGMEGAATAAVDRSLVASRNHREAERRRRERIKSHLDRLRSILACDPKIDKASLLAKVVERVKDLKQQAAVMAEAPQNFFPTETDEIIVLPNPASAAAGGSGGGGGGGRPVLEASVCCEDRSSLLPELIETLRSLRLKTLRAEISTLGGRVRNVLILAKDEEEEKEEEEEVSGDDAAAPAAAFLRDALKALVERPLPAEHCKRRRLVDRNVLTYPN